jgi:hypothetical protein
MSEVRDIHRTIRHLEDLAARPGTPEEGKVARDAADRLRKQHADSAATKPGRSTGPQKATTSAVNHPFHSTAIKHGYTHSPSSDYDIDDRTFHTYTKGEGKKQKRLKLVTYHNNSWNTTPETKHRWEDRGIDSGFGHDAKSLHDHLTASAAKKSPRSRR